MYQMYHSSKNVLFSFSEKDIEVDEVTYISSSHSSTASFTTPPSPSALASIASTEPHTAAPDRPLLSGSHPLDRLSLDIFSTAPQLWISRQEGSTSCSILCPFWRKPLQSCDCALRSRLWWGQRCRSSPRRWRARRDSLCRRTWRRQSSPWGRDGSLLPWCCRQIPGHHRSLLPLPQCSAVMTRDRLQWLGSFPMNTKTKREIFL